MYVSPTHVLPHRAHHDLPKRAGLYAAIRAAFAPWFQFGERVCTYRPADCLPSGLRRDALLFAGVASPEGRPGPSTGSPGEALSLRFLLGPRGPRGTQLQRGLDLGLPSPQGARQSSALSACRVRGALFLWDRMI